MKAALVTRYDKNNIALSLQDVATPHAGAGQVLVRVSAAGVNPLDNMISRGEVKIITPYQLPLVAGNEVVGRVVQVGSAVHQFREGDRVFGRLPLESIGAFAEYVAVDAAALARVPDYLSDEEAAAVPLTALTVIQAFDLMQVEPGKTIFISGGSGGVGAMAIPLAKARGLTVITNGSAANRERVLNLGADRFIDYKSEDYSRSLNEIDYVLDTLGGKETKKQLGILAQGGHLVSLRGGPNGRFARRINLPGWKQTLFTLVGLANDRAAKKQGATYDFIFVESNGKQLQEVADLLSELEIRPSLDTVFPFEEVNTALEKVAHGNSRGKTVLAFEREKK